ncbi:MAG: hypothetical protein NTX59_08045 [Elusimicrobia bacterium]|nr:hypothetical protein [Elusimicrobiota bacterium]
MNKLIIAFVFITVGMNCPIAAQLPSGDNSSGKDKLESEVNESTETIKQEYIEITGGETENQRKSEVKFISSQGKLIKSIKPSSSVKKQKDKWLNEYEEIRDAQKETGLVMINRTRQLMPYDPRKETYGRDSAYKGEYWDKEIETLNAKGESLFKKSFRTYPGADLMTTTYWRNAFAGDTSHFFVYYRDEKGGGNIEIYKATGELVAHGRAEHDIDKIEISPDGSMAAGYVDMYDQEGEPKYIFLLDVKTGTTKLAKASGKINGRQWDSSFYFNPNFKSKACINVWIVPNYPNEKVNGWDGYLVFNEIPENLSILMKQENTK